MLFESQAPLRAVEVCGTMSSFTHSTVSPAAISSAAGWYENRRITIRCSAGFRAGPAQCAEHSASAATSNPLANKGEGRPPGTNPPARGCRRVPARSLAAIPLLRQRRLDLLRVIQMRLERRLYALEQRLEIRVLRVLRHLIRLWPVLDVDGIRIDDDGRDVRVADGGRRRSRCRRRLGWSRSGFGGLLLLPARGDARGECQRQEKSGRTRDVPDSARHGSSSEGTWDHRSQGSLGLASAPPDVAMRLGRPGPGPFTTDRKSGSGDSLIRIR